MKANEAPEKLYLHPTANGNVGASWLVFPLTNEDVEYIRTDAFIEKACEWIEDHIYEYLKMNRTWNDPDYDSKLIGDFRNYMKGE